MPSSLPRVYLVAGTLEPFFLKNAARWAVALREAGADVVMTERVGSHGDAFSREEFPLMVAWAVGHGAPQVARGRSPRPAARSHGAKYPSTYRSTGRTCTGGMKVAFDAAHPYPSNSTMPSRPSTSSCGTAR